MRSVIYRFLIVDKFKVGLFTDFIENIFYRLVLYTERNVVLFQCLSSSRSN